MTTSSTPVLTHLLRTQGREEAKGALAQNPGEVSSHGEAEKAELLTKTSNREQGTPGVNLEVAMAKKFLFFVGFFFPGGRGEQAKLNVKF